MERVCTASVERVALHPSSDKLIFSNISYRAIGGGVAHPLIFSLPVKAKMKYLAVATCM